MSRWPPDSAARLKANALALFAERGFTGVTAAEIAAAAGMSERTFFRHFKAKEDVLFAQDAAIREELTEVIAKGPPEASVRSLMQAVADLLGARFENERAEHRLFAEVLTGEPALRARALLIDQDYAGAIAAGFRRRGFSDASAALIAAATAATFRVVYDAWLVDEGGTTLGQRFGEAARELASALEPDPRAN